MSHDSFQLNMLLTSHDRFLFKPAWCIKETTCVTSGALILWQLIRHSTTETKITFVKTQDFNLHFLLNPLLVEFYDKSDLMWVYLLSIWCILFHVHVMNVDRNKQRVFMSRAIYQPEKLWTTFSKTLTLYTILCKIGQNGFNAPWFLDLICYYKGFGAGSENDNNMISSAIWCK